VGQRLCAFASARIVKAMKKPARSEWATQKAPQYSISSSRSATVESLKRIGEGIALLGLIATMWGAVIVAAAIKGAP
jgi:preprotein translocase subunit Sss1